MTFAALPGTRIVNSLKKAGVSNLDPLDGGKRFGELHGIGMIERGQPLQARTLPAGKDGS